MNKGLLIQYYHRSCRWRQAEPCYVNQHEGEIWHGHNCGTEFFDNYCPRCSHRVEVGRVGWNSIRESITILRGLNSLSFTYSLVQVMGCPGYLVRDYIWWSTLWRFAVSVCYNDDEVMDVNMTIDFYIILAAIVLLTAVMLIAVHRINKRAIN